MTRAEDRITTPAAERLPAPPHVLVDGIKIFDGGDEEAAAHLAECVTEGRGARVATVNLDFLVQARNDPILRRDLAESSLVVADGAPVAWLARRQGAEHVRRVAGVDLVQRLCAEAHRNGHLRVAIYGSTFGTAQAAAERLRELNGRVEVVCMICPPFRPCTRHERATELRAIASAKPDVVLVALGCPKQERLIADYHAAAPQAVWIGVGGTLDILAGMRKRAPRWMQAAGLEWVARLAQEPGRLWKRYLLRDIPFLIGLAPRYLAPRRRSGRAAVGIE